MRFKPDQDAVLLKKASASRTSKTGSFFMRETGIHFQELHSWRPRDEDTLMADELTNEQFHNVDKAKRAPLSVSHLGLSLFEELWEEREKFLHKESRKHDSKVVPKKVDRKKSKSGSFST